MKLTLALFSFVFSLPAFATPADDFKNQFKDFTGHYKVVNCAQIVVEDLTQPPQLNASCGTEAEIFFGSNYGPSEDFAGLFMMVTSPTLKVGTGLAEFLTDPGEFCATAAGIQICTNVTHEYMLSVSLRKSADGIVHLHWTITSPQAGGRGALINDLNLDLKGE